MYGPSDGQIAFFIFMVALLGGAAVLGVEHGCGYVVRHVEIRAK